VKVPESASENVRFRAFNGAAPLKLDQGFCARFIRKRFPRLQRRGPIEATRNFCSSDNPPLFPRLQRRGPIEAISTAAWACATFRGFRAFNGAAPLKLVALMPLFLYGEVSAPSTARPH